MSETTPKPIDPQDIRVGMRVRRTFTHENGRILIDEFTVRAVAGGAIDFDDHAGFAADHLATWTLLADAPKPVRPAGSHWRDPETSAEYVRTDETSDGNAHYVAITHGRDVGADDRLIPDYSIRDREIIARLTPIPAFDPATLWPHAPAFARDCIAHSDGWSCSRGAGHDGMHAAYVGADTPPVYVWGDPR